MRISDWSSDVCSSDLCPHPPGSCSWADADKTTPPAAPSTHQHHPDETHPRQQVRASTTAPTPPADCTHRSPNSSNHRSEESRVGKECVSQCRSGGSPYH